MKTYTNWGLFKEAAAIIKPNLWKVIGQFWVIEIISIISSIILNKIFPSNLNHIIGAFPVLLYFVGLAIKMLITITLSLIIIHYALAYVRKAEFKLETALDRISSGHLWKYFLAYVLISFIAGVVFSIIALPIFIILVVKFSLAYMLVHPAVFAFFLIPMIVAVMVMIPLSLTQYVAAEQKTSARKSLRESLRLTKGYRLQITGFFLLTLVINILGAMCLLVGLIYTVPLTVVASALMYNKILAQKNAPMAGENILATDAVSTSIEQTLAPVIDASPAAPEQQSSEVASA